MQSNFLVRGLALAALLLATPLAALDPPKVQAPPPPAAEAATPTPEPAAEAPAKVPATDIEETLPPLPPGSATSGPSPQRFTPSEKVRADFPVSFPIDI